LLSLFELLFNICHLVNKTLVFALALPKQAVGKFLCQISKLILIHAGKARNDLFCNISKLILLCRLFAPKVLDPVSSTIVDFLRNVSKFIFSLTHKFSYMILELLLGHSYGGIGGDAEECDVTVTQKHHMMEFAFNLLSNSLF
jgi:hypothetical protein